VSGAGSRKMVYCIFQNNQNHLFCVWSGSLEVSHSFIEHSSSSFSTSTAVSKQVNNSLTNIMTYHIQFYCSHHCNADLTQIGSKNMYTIVSIPNFLFKIVYPMTIIMI